ncbi:hypothetical protein DRV85_00730 [Rhodosalinus halophilus]|uniref:Cytochrome c domain-containing protein n=1 Tax=Rhodosalinus halophilus TaxID=2259333 RepID=A0A365UD65_9RHOB|nr:hypothetical protein [Rhodosalinus halophilus]RBI87489.1 hypothetical protein DRV85_00730 [Rhodosalinus halophilus]
MAEGRASALLGALLLAGAALAQGDAFDFMPPGGREILASLAGGDANALAEIAGREHDRDGWAEWTRAQAPDLEAAQVETFAAYAALNLPAGEDVLAEVADSGGASALPPDGKDLAVQQCQFCHSMFSGYLMHDRDEAGWLSTFKAPFHLEIPMNETERATFAAYSAINMPMKMQDVPPELRF